MTPKNRIWELDAARGFCILGMITIHFIFDLTELYPIIHLKSPSFFLLVKNWGGIAFFLISGICVTLGQHHLRRGAIVFGCAVLVSTVTVLAGFAPIRFGVLHCLGLCMLCWAFFRRVPAGILGIFGCLLAVLGLVFARITVAAPYLYPLGLTAPGFESADYFPLLPYLGYFLLGACLGRTLYHSRRSLLPNFPINNPIVRLLRFCGRHSLLLYLIHQPILIFLIEAAISTGGTFHEAYHQS